MSLTNRFRPSYWESQTYLATYDVAIVGSGIVGLNAAITLKKRHPSLRVIIVERGVYPIGASTRNAGFACFGSISEVLSDIGDAGYDKAIELFLKRKRGLDRLFSIVDPFDVDYMHLGGNEVFTNGDEERYKGCMDVIDRLNTDLRSTFGTDVFVDDDASIARQGLRNFSHLIAHPMEGQLHPGKLVRALVKVAASAGVVFANGFDVSGIKEAEKHCVLISDQVKIKARFVVVASNGFAGQLVDDIELVPARNQVLVTEPVQGLKLSGCFHYNEGYVYFRNIDGRILIGGARNIAIKQEETTEFGITDTIGDWLRSFLKEHVDAEIPGIDHVWSGIMGVGPVKEPIVRMTGTRIAVAVRLGGMGVAIGSLVGEEAADLIGKQI